MRHLAIERKINQTYAKRLAAKGSQPEGVFWNSEANQINRFVTLLALINTVTRTEQVPAMLDALFQSLRSVVATEHSIDICSKKMSLTDGTITVLI